MSLLDALLRDSLLNPPVMQQNYYIALRTDGVKGAGTMEDPFNGSTQALFDAAINNIPAFSTIFLGPSKFDANGVVTQPFLTNGITLKNGQRLVGSGTEVTVVKFNMYAPNVFKAAISSSFLPAGAEVSDLKINANLLPYSIPSGYYYSAGGINLNGNNILVKRVRVINAGSNSSSIPATAICVANSDTIGQVPTNCVVDSCSVDTPSGNHDNGATLIAIGFKAAPTGGTMNYHQNCGIRCCYIDLGYNPASPKEFVGIAATGCAGTIIEQNRIFNCKVGGPYQSGGSSDRYASKDLIVRQNFYKNVLKGVSIALDNSSGYTFVVDRAVALQNEFEMLGSGSPVGIEFTEANASANDSFINLVIRGNIIRLSDSLSVIPGGKGIVFEAGGYVICENNVINVQNNNDSVIRKRGLSVQVFNNRRPNGQFLQAYDQTTGLLIAELTTEAENYVLTL